MVVHCLPSLKNEKVKNTISAVGSFRRPVRVLHGPHRCRMRAVIIPLTLDPRPAQQAHQKTIPQRLVMQYIFDDKSRIPSWYQNMTASKPAIAGRQARARLKSMANTPCYQPFIGQYMYR
jgi:hypothetical protein